METILVLLVPAALIVAAIAFIVRVGPSEQDTTQPAQRAPTTSNLPEGGRRRPVDISLWETQPIPARTATYGVQVVGEWHYRAAVFDVLGARVNSPGENGTVEHETTAVLVPQPRNTHDANAIRVVTSGLLVGYLSRTRAKTYGPLLNRQAKAGVIYEVPLRLRWTPARPGDEKQRNVLELAISLGSIAKLKQALEELPEA
ncbi:HIRAN domain-containing protein [uncultured Brachybacterium sp.]|uniref:HIRAN domain-containing protein n=1 Tax=uncultured Brachybacterium sp. TaxID=189680 RepID=UPI00260478A0|nr:HIRAN domain-containing protein [uncultured Brachybacterium sp.]